MRYGKGEEIVCLVMKVMRKEFIMNKLDNIKIDLSKNNPYHTTIIEELYKGEKYIAYFKCGRCGKTFKSFIKNIVKYKYKVCYDCMKEIENEANIKYKMQKDRFISTILYNIIFFVLVYLVVKFCFDNLKDKIIYGFIQL